jgi:hypothetical protein
VIAPNSRSALAAAAAAVGAVELKPPGPPAVRLARTDMEPRLEMIGGRIVEAECRGAERAAGRVAIVLVCAKCSVCFPFFDSPGKFPWYAKRLSCFHTLCGDLRRKKKKRGETQNTITGKNKSVALSSC